MKNDVKKIIMFAIFLISVNIVFYKNIYIIYIVFQWMGYNIL